MAKDVKNPDDVAREFPAPGPLAAPGNVAGQPVQSPPQHALETQHGLGGFLQGKSLAEILALVQTLLSLFHAKQQTAQGVQRQLAPHSQAALEQHGLWDTVQGWDAGQILGFVINLLQFLKSQGLGAAGPTPAPPAP